MKYDGRSRYIGFTEQDFFPGRRLLSESEKKHRSVRNRIYDP